MKPLRRSTLAEQAYEELSSQIVSGHLPAGRRLLPEELASQLSISQTPVKEALALLERDGLIVGAARRASAVRSFSKHDILEIYEARTMLELNALEIGRLEARVTEEFLQLLEGLHKSQIRFADKRTISGLAESIRFDREFHESMLGLTRNQLMIGWHRNILRQTQTIRNHSISTYDAQRSRRDHGSLVDALRSSDFGAANAILRDHLTASRDGLVARWKGDHAEKA